MPIPRLCRALALACVLLLLGACAAHAAIVPDQVVVRFAPDASRSDRVDALSNAGAQDAHGLSLPDTQVVELPAGSDERAAAQQLERQPDVVWAEPNYVVEADATTPDDPLFADLWGLSNTGQSANQALSGVWTPQAGVAGIDVGAPAAWDTTTGSSAVRVGVVDTGIAAHRDLDANVDGARSRDFRAHTADTADDPRADAEGHGTHVAGTIGAVGDNGTDVAGVAWHSDLVALRALDAGSGTSADVAAAFAYAGDQGIPIVNASLGGTANSLAVADAIRSHPATLYVVAAGNDGANVESAGSGSYPCELPYANVLCVASIDNDGALSDYSNYGASAVDLAAPGNGVVSTYPSYTDALSANGSWAHGGSGDSWSFSGGMWTSDVAASMSSTLESPDVDVSAMRGCSVRLTLVSAIPSGQGSVAIERSLDGGSTWEQVGVRTTPTAGTGLAYAADADNRSSVRIRVVVTTTAAALPTSSAIGISGLSLRCLTPGTSTQTATLAGTSMATPMVAGVAALLLAAKPGATTAELRSALLSSVTPTAALNGRTVTGGRVNAAAALAALLSTPAPTPSGGGGLGGGGLGGGRRRRGRPGPRAAGDRAHADHHPHPGDHGDDAGGAGPRAQRDAAAQRHVAAAPRPPGGAHRAVGRGQRACAGHRALARRPHHAAQRPPQRPERGRPHDPAPARDEAGAGARCAVRTPPDGGSSCTWW